MAASGDDGSITVSRLDERIIECCGRGHLRLAHVLAAQATMDALYREILGRIDSLFDGTAIEGFEPGVPIRWVRWRALHQERTGRVAIVGRPGPLLAVATTFQYLLPSVRHRIFTNRDAAIAFLKTANDGGPRGGR